MNFPLSEKDQSVLPYTVLVYEEPGLGTWVKLPEFEVQCLTEDWEVGLGLIEEQLDFQLGERRRKGEQVPGRLQRTVRRVGHEDYGLTQLELEQQRQLEAWGDEEWGGEDEREEPGPPVITIRARFESRSGLWAGEIAGLTRDQLREPSAESLMMRAREVIDREYRRGKQDEPEGGEPPYAVHLDQPLDPMCDTVELRQAFEEVFSVVPNRVFLVP